MSHSSLPHTSGIPHPWLDPQEKPVPALLRLLQLQPTNMQESSAFDLNEAQLAEAIGFQARRCHQCVSDGIAALQSAPADARLPGLIVHLQSEADATRQIVVHYEQMARNFFANPTPPAPTRRFMRIHYGDCAQNMAHMMQAPRYTPPWACQRQRIRQAAAPAF